MSVVAKLNVVALIDGFVKSCSIQDPKAVSLYRKGSSRSEKEHSSHYYPMRRWFALVGIMDDWLDCRTLSGLICSKCHPFFTGQSQRSVVTGGQVNRFTERLARKCEWREAKQVLRRA
jgi:ribosomal protein L31